MLISWDREYKHPCPCGEGRFAHRQADYDGYAGVKSEDWVMLCRDCISKYAFDRRKPMDAFDSYKERGWVLKSDLKKEETYRRRLQAFQANVVKHIDKMGRKKWRELLARCKTKQAVWSLVRPGQAYSTFLSHHRGQTLQELIQDQQDEPLRYGFITDFLSICGINCPDPDSLATIDKPTAPASLPSWLRAAWDT